LSGVNLGKTKRDIWLYCGTMDFIASIEQAELRAKAYSKSEKAAKRK
jgi:hypothetical protein